MRKEQAVHCAAYRTEILHDVFIEPLLKFQQCQQCDGAFLSFAIYQQWRAYQGIDLPEHPDPHGVVQIAEPVQAKQCPACRHLQYYFPFLQPGVQHIIPTGQLT
jgi:hypothetical protein